ELARCILSRETLGAGGTMVGFEAGEVRVLACETSGAGGTIVFARLVALRLGDGFEFSSGEGGTGRIVGSAGGRFGATREERNPSAGGGPGLGLKARRLATAASECGRLILGASTTLSLALSPRATRMVWVRWWACWPPARPALPDWA